MATWEANHGLARFYSRKLTYSLESEAELLALYYEAHDAEEAPTTTYRALGQSLYKNIGGYGHAWVKRFLMYFSTHNIPATAVLIKANLKVLLKKNTPVDQDHWNFYVKLRAGTDLNALASDKSNQANFSKLLTYGQELESWYADDLSLDEYTEFNVAISTSLINRSEDTIFGFLTSRDEDRIPPPMPPDGENSTEAVRLGKTSDYCVLSVTYAEEPGFIWVDGRRFYFISEVDKKHIEGRYAGVYGATPGYLYVEGLYLVYIDEAGHKRKRKGYKKGATGVDVSNGCPIWVEKTKIRYVDASGNERFLPIWWFNTDVFNRAVFNG